MISHKQQMVVTNIFRRLGMALLIGAAWFVGLELLVYIIGLLINHNWMSFAVSLKGIPGTVTGILAWIVPFYFLLTPYADFKWTIQNGISRKTMWRGRLLALVLSTIVAFSPVFVNWPPPAELERCLGRVPRLLYCYYYLASDWKRLCFT